MRSTKVWAFGIWLALVVTQILLPEDLEPRTPLAKFLLEGTHVFLYTAGLLLWGTILGVRLLLNGKRWQGLLLGLPSGGFFLVAAFLSIWSLSELRGLKEDQVRYVSLMQPARYLIGQYFESGVTGNPRHRLILTNTPDASFREFEEVEVAYPADSASDAAHLLDALHEGSIDSARLPQLVGLKGKRFRFESVK